ncbi:DUF1229 domain-containing protein [Leptospira sp. 201903070]|uniref:DUF1229 domain-containing protein n=1 Tax=Leptospira ainlahdjerensis TaxID=2810033 RepID=A0ABS2UCK5_9LEPT|nr:DUF1229 domain-containing protein [Leptospira ainlahdjerensis]MBM9577283.1 DUF1229 domain-containing protein [Leptospira ainlahdjerensis]
MNFFLFKVRLFSLPAIYWVCSLLIGFGSVSVRLSLLTIVLSFSLSIYLLRRIKLNIFSILLLLLLVGFLFTYYLFYEVPVLPNEIDGKLYLVWYLFKALPVFFSFLIILGLPDATQKKLFFIGIAFGMFLFAIVNTLATVAYLDPPYYGKAYHLFLRSEYNSPGITILASMLPIALFCFEGYFSEIKTHLKAKQLFFGVVFLISLFISFLFSARTFFFIVLLNVVVLSVIWLWRSLVFSEKSRIYKISISLVVAISLILLIFFFLNFTEIGQRMLHGVYSEKINHQVDYWTTIRKGFFVYPKIQINSSFTFWYHNFFYDTHKTSGPFTALLIYAYFIISFVLLLIRLTEKAKNAIEYFHFYVCFLPYLFTSIPWESSEPQMIALYSGLGALISTLQKDDSPISNSKQKTEID